MTQAVAAAQGRLSEKLIKKSFKECGISLNPNSSKDNLLKIKDLLTVLFNGWEKQLQKEEDREIKINSIQEEEQQAYVLNAENEVEEVLG